MIMASVYLMEQNPNPTREQVREALSGNLCRCTGYQKIIDAVHQASSLYQVKT
jgi:carbon-monoxide dehydrogenase small subunit